MLRFTSNDVMQEAKNYLDLETDMNDQVKSIVNNFRVSTKYPVCILSHLFDKKRSKFLVQLKEESELRDLNRKYYIFTYEDQKDLYQQFESIPNVHVVYIPLEKEFMSLSGKRQYILDWNKENDHAFFIEDDCFDFHLPIGAIGESGSFRNKRFNISFDFLFSFWENLIDDYSLTYSGPVNNMEFAFRDLRVNPFIKKNGQVVQSVHISTKLCREKNIKFDHNSGWDDYDMILQQCIYGNGTQALIFGYITPTLKSGVSAMSNNENALKERCERNTTALINKWGLALVREDTKKGLYNAKVNWSTLRKANKINFDLTKLVGKTKEEANSLLND